MKDIASCFAKEILNSILQEIGHGVFCLLVDNSRDVSCKEQMAVVLCYVDSFGIVKQSSVGVYHVKERQPILTSSLQLILYLQTIS
jgi:RAB protein geranylgeranyltransferase component A